MDGTIPSQVGLGYIRKMAEDEDVEVGNQHPSWLLLQFLLNFLL